ncbi:Mth938-like domain-containing protein [Chloroflexota bacterium]
MAVTVNSYNFGLIEIDGKGYASDVVIFPDRVQANWWRKTGHELSLEDIAEVIAEHPEVVVVGTGDSGLMKVLTEVKQGLDAKGIGLIVQPTGQACNTYNQLCCSRKAVGAFHITC